MNLKDKIIYKLRDAVEAIRENRILQNLKNTRFGNFANLVREDRKIFGLLLVVMFLGVIAAGSFTGHVVLTKEGVNEIKNNLSIAEATLETCQDHLLDCNYEKTGLSNQITSLNGQVGSLNEQISLLNSNLGLCNLEKDIYNISLQNCTNEKDILSTKLGNCRTDVDILIEELTEYEDLQVDYEKIKINFAKDRCCPNYNYYTVTGNSQILCCYKDDGDYICGAGEETDKDDIERLNC
ncbi:MAG: hypothetical protein KAT28_01230 [Candidatus Aenigmarchaeota archaeon]|nr:hypothetical protein [Candidatus Aenigmarchaeota archaeon]